MKKILSIIIGGAIICAIAGYWFITYGPKISDSKKPRLSERITDVIVLKSGNDIRGKILKETPDSILIRNAAETAEIVVPKIQIASMRKATAGDLKAAKAELDNAEKEAKAASLYDVEREARLKAYYEQRNKMEAPASKGSGEPDLEEAIRAAKSRGEITTGMSYNDVIEVLGQPDSKKSEFEGNAVREQWFYKACKRIKKDTVSFYDGKVQ